mmetsp:Transcript_24745/g.38557  ORF Transcript_24745/g.38557 Transcript_24745/m.38557 type:complete len:163 (-) Transcript_24745:3-491(-)
MSMNLASGLTIGAFMSGVVAFGAGLATYFSFKDASSIAVPMQFDAFGQPTWSIIHPEALLIYPFTAAFLTIGVLSISPKSSECCTTKHYTQLFVSFVGIITNLFMLLLASVYVPQIVKREEESLPPFLVMGFLVLIALSSLLYFIFSLMSNNNNKEEEKKEQ